MSFFPSRKRCCPECCQRKVEVKGEEVIEYYHRGVVFYLAGFPMAMPLDVEIIRPGEDEMAAAGRLLLRFLKPYGRLFDLILTDALYFEAPFLNFCTDHGKHVITVRKDEKRLLFQDAKGLFSQSDPRQIRLMAIK